MIFFFKFHLYKQTNKIWKRKRDVSIQLNENISRLSSILFILALLNIMRVYPCMKIGEDWGYCF